MNRVLRFVFSTTAVIATACCAIDRAIAYDDYGSRQGYAYGTGSQYQPSPSYYPSQQQQYAPARQNYQQSYNYNETYRQSTYGPGYQPQQYGVPQSSDQQYGGGGTVDADAGGTRRHRRRHHSRAVREGGDIERVRRSAPSREPVTVAPLPRYVPSREPAPLPRSMPSRETWSGSGAAQPSPGRLGWVGAKIRRAARNWISVPASPAPAAPMPPAPQQGGGWYAYGQVAACVRTCDGYFFPMGLVGDQNSVEGQRSLCTALCPNAKTELYFMSQGGDGISTAINASGRPYSRMPNALRYTKAVGSGCTCHGTSGQARLVSLLKDFTMRRGDAVMTASGVLVFNGNWQWPYRLADFQVLDKAKYYLSNALALAALERAALRLPQWARGPKTVDEKAIATAGPFTFITDNNGKTVRLVGDALSYAPTTSLPIQPILPAISAHLPTDGEPRTIR